MHHHHDQGLDSSQMANTAAGVYFGIRAAQGDWVPLAVVMLFAGGWALVGAIVTAIIYTGIIALPFVAVGAVAYGVYFAVTRPRIVAQAMLRFVIGVAMLIGYMVAVLFAFGVVALPFAISDAIRDGTTTHVGPFILLGVISWLAVASWLCFRQAWRARHPAAASNAISVSTAIAILRSAPHH
jgi:hypothetical protein